MGQPPTFRNNYAANAAQSPTDNPDRYGQITLVGGSSTKAAQ